MSKMRRPPTLIGSSDDKAVSIHSDVLGCELQDDDRQLLPGIADDITLDRIAPKLPWRSFHILSSVSPAWKRAIQSRTVYDARVRYCSTEALVVIPHLICGPVRAIGLYSTRDRTFCLLPPIPDEEAGMPCEFHCVALDGKVYVLGGAEDGDASCRMYVMDLAAQGLWESCASMTSGRRDFGCGVLDGKIYVIGGSCRPSSGALHSNSDCVSSPVCVPEVYDPKLDVWSPMKRMLSTRILHGVISMGNELFVNGGLGYNPNYIDEEDQMIFDDPYAPPNDFISYVDFLEVYNQGSDEWRRVDRFCEKSESLFVAHGKFHSISTSGICVHDIDNKSFTDCHSFYLGDILHDAKLLLRMRHALAVENELVAFLTWYVPGQRRFRQCILQSRGFGGTETSITWQRVEYPKDFRLWDIRRVWGYGPAVLGSEPLPCTVQL